MKASSFYELILDVSLQTQFKLAFLWVIAG